MGNAAWAENVKCINLNVGLHKSGFLNSNQVKSNHMFLKKIQVKSNQDLTKISQIHDEGEEGRSTKRIYIF